MHEAGIAASILDIAVQAAQQRGPGTRVRSVRIRLGEFTGVAVEALEFAFESLRSGSCCEGAVLELDRVPLLGVCPQCGWTGPPVEDYCLVCPTCASPVDVLSGREMDVESIEIEEEGAAAYGTTAS